MDVFMGKSVIVTKVFIGGKEEEGRERGEKKGEREEGGEERE